VKCWPGFLHTYQAAEQFVRLGALLIYLRHTAAAVGSSTRIGAGTSFFILYTVDPIEFIRSQGLCPHLYADDTQLYGSCRPGQAPSLAESLRTAQACVDLVAGCMRSNRLQLNGDKTEVLWVASVRRHQHQLPTLPLTVGGQLVNPVRSVRNLHGRVHRRRSAWSCAPTWFAW
jgi:hypothetical protein